LIQLIALGCLAPLSGLAVVAQYHYSSAFFVAGDPAEGWRRTLEQVGNLVRIPYQQQDLAFLFAVAVAAALATYAFAPGRRRLSAVFLLPLPSAGALVVADALSSSPQAFDPPLAPNLGLFSLGILSLSIAWAIVFTVVERFGPGPGEGARSVDAEALPPEER